MALSEPDRELFYKLLTPLHFYANHKYKLFAKYQTLEEFRNCPTADRMVIRNKIIEDPALIDQFVADNPESFTYEELEILQGWRQYQVKDRFILERHLKKGSIFVASDPQIVYLVSGITSPLSEMIFAEMLPMMLETVIMPFKGKIVYDGLLSHTPIQFGSNVAKTWAKAYLAAKQSKKVITTFGEQIGKEDDKPARKRKRESEEPKVPFEMKKELEELARRAKRVKEEAQPGRESSAASVLLNASQMMKRIVDGGPNLKRAVTSVRKSLELLENELKGPLDEKDEPASALLAGGMSPG